MSTSAVAAATPGPLRQVLSPIRGQLIAAAVLASVGTMLTLAPLAGIAHIAKLLLAALDLADAARAAVQAELWWVAGASVICLFAGMALISWMCLSRKCLSAEAMGVSSALERSLADGRGQVARIVGRDTAQLNSEEIVKATVETVAENTTDGVISPMIYLMLGGPVLGMGFKAASTLDSMVGYLDEKYRDIGWSSARLDDVLNYVPARLCALLLCASAWLLGLDARGAWRIVRRDHANHKSPNCAWSEAAAAGALGIQLGGTHLYFGKPVEKPTIGDALRPATSGMIRQTCRLMTVATLLAAGICAACALGIAL